jgi:thiamine-phosphate pyrophosphorylase
LRKFLYLISPNKIKPSFYLDLEEVLSSNKVMFFQLRLKDYSASKILNIGKKIRKITKKYKVKFLINDSFKIAKNINADGCHIGQSDGTINSARDVLKKKIIGITCHGSKRLILNAIKEKPNYLALGSFFKSKLKPNAKKAQKKLIKWTKRRTSLPIVAIGGINNKNCKSLLKLGVNYLAISSFIWNNPRLKPKEVIKLFN